MENIGTRNPRGSYHVFSGRRTSIDVLSVRTLVLRAFFLAVAFFALCVLAAMLIALSPTLSRSITAFFVSPQVGAVPWNGTDPVNMVIAGIDVRAGAVDSSPHTDTIVVASVNPSTGAVHMLSVPRDLWVNIPGYGPDRINDAYADGGTKLLMQTLEGVVNMPIRYYVIVRFTGFEKVIDAVGGVTIDVKKTIRDPKYPAFTGNGYDPLYIKAGVQHMNGSLALKYVRTRHDDVLGDIGRNQRQQQLLQALKQQVLKPSTLFTFPTLLSALQQAVSTNFPYDDLTYLARLVMTAHPQHRFLNYNNNSFSNFVTSGGADVLLPNWQRIHWIAHQAFNNPELSSVPVEVLNGSGITGQAGALAQWMRASGFNVNSVGNASTGGHVQSEVILNSNGSGGGFVARMAANLLQAPIVAQAVPRTSTPVVIIVGQAWVDPAQS